MTKLTFTRDALQTGSIIVNVGADRFDCAEHLAQVAGDRDLLDRMHDATVLDAEVPRADLLVPVLERASYVHRVVGVDQPEPVPTSWSVCSSLAPLHISSPWSRQNWRVHVRQGLAASAGE